MMWSFGASSPMFYMRYNMIKPHNDETHHHAFRVSLCLSKSSTKRILNELDSSKLHERSKKTCMRISKAFSSKLKRKRGDHLDQALEKDFNTLLPFSAQSKQQRASKTRTALPFDCLLNFSTAHQRQTIERFDAFVLSRIFHTLGSRMIFIQKAIPGFISDLIGFDDYTRLGTVLCHQLVLSMRKAPLPCGQTHTKTDKFMSLIKRKEALQRKVTRLSMATCIIKRFLFIITMYQKRLFNVLRVLYRCLGDLMMIVDTRLLTKPTPGRKR